MVLGWSFGARMLRWLLSAVVTVLVLYALAGRWDLPWLWATAAAGSLLTLALTLTIGPDLARERRHPGPRARDGATRVVMVAAMAVQMVIACVDVGRFHWSDSVPEALRAAALGSFTAGFALVTWSVAVNRFFSSVIRIQEERGHTIITTGPYRYVRHPGYLGMLLGYPVLALAIGSWWALVPGLACGLIVLRRAALEDAYLLERLAGYRDYADRVRSRLIPGMW